MELEEALITQSPSLALQRSAANRIAELRKEAHDAYTNGYQAARAEMKAYMEHEIPTWKGPKDESHLVVKWAFASVLDQLGVSTDGILTDRDAELRKIARQEF